MQTYNFEVQLRQDTNLPVNFSPKVTIQGISWEPKLLQATQEPNLLVGHLKWFLTSQELLHDLQL
jgi:hypothetical protein